MTARRHAAFLLAFALGGSPLPVAAEYSDDPDLAAKDEDYAAALKAVADKRWEEAIARLRKAEVRNPDHADLQNLLGYSHRNLRQFDPSFRHYNRALEIDPRHRSAHEYIGEAYLMVGDLAGAEKHLAALKAICLLGCEQLAHLEKAIAEHRKK
ncbi:MAG TPA: tetratricopeptide repeat protein [Usitatibacter sp.]|nr:tetratricopeptide repeat protein [Usitatibacter sp.]